MSEPCHRCEGYPAAIGSFVASTRAHVLTTHALEEMARTVARVVELNDRYDAMGMDVPTCELSKAIEGAS